MTHLLLFLAGSAVTVAILFGWHVRMRRRRHVMLHDREWFSTLIEDASDAIVVVDTTGTITFASRAIERILGYAPDELVGTDNFATKHPDDVDRVRRAMQRLLADPAGRERLEYRARRKDGRWVHVSTRARNRLAEPTVGGIVINVRDVTEERRIEAELRAAEERYHDLVEGLPLIVYSFEPHAPYLPMYVSVRISMLGYTREAWLDRPDSWLAALHPDDRSRVIRGVEEASASDAAFAIEYRMLGKHGGVHWVHDRGRFVFDENGQAVARQGVILDVTQSHEAERALRESEERYRQMFELSATANFVTTPAGRLVACNDNFVSLFGFEDRDAVLLVNAQDFYAIRSQRTELLERLRRDGKVEMLELQGQRMDGAVIPVLMSARALVDEHGAIREIHGQLLDITERRRLEEQLRHAQKVEALGRLAGGIAHDFNNLLTVIGSYSTLLHDALPEEVATRGDLKEIGKAVESGVSLTRQLLTFSRHHVPEATFIEVDAAIRDAERMVRRLLRPEIDLQLRLEAPGAHVLMERGHLDQILLNLFLNSDDALPNGGLIVVSSALANGRTGDGPGPREFVRIEVRDNGIGMDPDTAARAIDPFFTTKGLGHGTGLGLSTVYGIVKQAGGDLSIQSQPAQGTAVALMLPTHDAPVEPRAPRVSPPPPLRHGKQRILVVDDEEGVRRPLARILERHGYLAVTAANGPEALAQWEQTDGGFDLLITDMRMAEMGGRELLDRLRERSSTIPVVVMSGYPDDDLELPDRDDAPVRFLAKPFTMDAVLLTVRTLIAPR